MHAGEVKNRADLVIFWGTDPQVSHPRHLERYSADPLGYFLPNGRADRHVEIIHTGQNQTLPYADHAIELADGEDEAALHHLRCRVAGLQPHSSRLSAALTAELDHLAQRMMHCRFGIIFFGSGLTQRPVPHRAIESLLRLVTALNDHTRFYVRRMRRLGDVAGADSVLTWQSGYPFAVNFAPGHPRYNPGEFSAPEMLARREIDACLIVGSETIAEFPAEALAHLQTIPIITLETAATVSDFPVAVRITTAIYGIHRPGTAYRMDEVPIPLRMLSATTLPSDGEVLAKLLAKL